MRLLYPRHPHPAEPATGKLVLTMLEQEGVAAHVRRYSHTRSRVSTTLTRLAVGFESILTHIFTTTPIYRGLLAWYIPTTEVKYQTDEGM